MEVCIIQKLGEELKKFNTRDGMGFQLLREAGIKTGIITSENTKIVENRAKKLKVDYLVQGKRDGGKLAAIREGNLSEGGYYTGRGSLYW